ncbi:hypothetical protein [Nocardioides currus]|uniref:Uncharacterized protein n=1 Tax=Nocardioides currus TaxID=2133958 RepID=A0A2R7YTK9_9ACTN|nr:hypothetical protein [Nocardioides currus]PUA79634.1 hypothetical protein C7S10_18115 [Nocardioides currus]
MTELLKDTMDQAADSLLAPDLDVQAMVREGDRRVGRRRTAVVGAGVAAAVVAAIAVPSLLPQDQQRATEPVGFAAVFEAHQPSWATGSEVHVGGRSFDAGHQVFAYVQTTEGVVFSDPSGQVWASNGTQTVGVGRTDAEHPRLEADGSRVAWTTYGDGRPTEFTVYDQATGEVDGLAAQTGDAEVLALDGTDVYARDGREIVRWSLATGTRTSLGRPTGIEIEDVKAGVIAHQLPHADDGATSPYFGRELGETLAPDFYQTLALSPDGTTALGESEADVPALADTATGAVTPITVPGYGFFVGFGWVDDDTYVGLGVNEPYQTTPLDLLECEVGGTCTVTAEAIGSAASGVVLPFGQSMDD